MRAALPEFDRQSFNAGHLTPVYFGRCDQRDRCLRSARRSGRVWPSATRAQPKPTNGWSRQPEPGLTALVRSQIQANMDPRTIATGSPSPRVCSGRLVRGMRLKQVRTGKQIPLHAPQFFFAREREIADEAFAGDVVGIPNHVVSLAYQRHA